MVVPNEARPNIAETCAGKLNREWGKVPRCPYEHAHKDNGIMLPSAHRKMHMHSKRVTQGVSLILRIARCQTCPRRCMTCLCHASLSFHVPSELSCRSKPKGPGSAQSKPKGSQVHLQLLVGFPLVLFKVHTLWYSSRCIPPAM